MVDSEGTQYPLVTLLTDKQNGHNAVRHTSMHTVTEVLVFVQSLQLKLSFPFIKCAIMARTIKTEYVRSLR